MKIYDISISYYRGIEHLENLKFGSVNTFVGKNDNGKSTILKSLDAFFNDKFTTHDVYKGIPDEAKTSIKIRFIPSEGISPLALDNEGFICITKQYSFTPAGKLKKEALYTCNDFVQENIQNCWGVKEAEINGYLDTLEVDYSRSGRGVTNLSKIIKIQENTEGYQKSLNTYLADEYLKNISKQYPDIKIPDYFLFDAEQDLNVGATEFQNQFKPIATKSLEDNRALTDQIESNVQSDLDTEFTIIANLMKKNVPDLEEIKPQVNCNWKNLVKFDIGLKFQSESFDIPISHKGTGFKRLLMVAYFEYLAQKNSNGNTIFGIEEPETFLHPELQYELLESILNLADDSQFLITTHSPVFAGATESTNIVVVKKQDGLSKYFNYENENYILDVVIQELGIRPNYNLLNDNYRKIIFVEGKGDCLFWQCAINKLSTTNIDDILFVPCGGDQVEFFVNARLCSKINRNFIFILDSDKGATDYESKLENKVQLKSDIEEMGGEFLVLRKREIENYYHRDAIQRVLGDEFTLTDDFIIDNYSDMKEEIKSKILAVKQMNFKAKNNMEVFGEMTESEWLEAGFTVSEGVTDLQEIIDVIVK